MEPPWSWVNREQRIQGLHHTRHVMVFVCGQEHVLGDVNLDPVTLADQDRGRDVDVAVEDVGALLRETRSDAGSVRF